MNEQKNPEGRPPLYKTSQELQSKIDEYFVSGVAVRKIIIGPANNRYETLVRVPTITGLVLYCGFNSRASFYQYEDKPEFLDTIKKARSRIEQEYEEQLQCGLGSGAIFALKNFGWKDVVEHSGKIEGDAIRNRTIIVQFGQPRIEPASAEPEIPNRIAQMAEGSS